MQPMLAAQFSHLEQWLQLRIWVKAGGMPVQRCVGVKSQFKLIERECLERVRLLGQLGAIFLRKLLII